ncbi:protein homooligomerization [Extremus antarcticus]|uniref:Protein homooligomerization n=1 Tax=Extremus antarcticus TaxID=702011 RepID=A0AAJ0D9H5_9PEZI|nr:protein homooligomerization [Extremus antarcticus]
MPEIGHTSSQVITLDVGGRKFVTTQSTLTEGSTFFASLLSTTWAGGRLQKDGDLFVDADPEIFAHLLAFLRRSKPPLFWTRTEGFNLALYAALQEEARFFGVSKLEDWISSKKYVLYVRIQTSIEFVTLSNCLNPGGGLSFGDVEETIAPGQFESKGGEKRRQVNSRKTELVLPDAL